MRRFILERSEDVSGTSGTGIVAEGIEFTDGTCVLHWVADEYLYSTAVYPDMERVIGIHGHGERTKVIYLDEIDPKYEFQSQRTIREMPDLHTSGIGH